MCSVRRRWRRAIFNLGSIIGGVAIGCWIDPHFGARSLVGLAIGTLIGGAWQLVGQFPSLWQVGYRFHAGFSLARRGRAHGADLDGAGGHRGERGAGECADQQRVCSEPGQRPGELAEHCVSPDAIAAGNFRRRDWHRDIAAGIEERRAREHG